MNNELYHFGIKGMKWGVRRTPEQLARSRASNYSEQQRTRDRKIYGKGAEKRINKRMLKGESIQSARHNEVVRKRRIESGKTVVASVATSALVLGGAAAVATIMQRKGIASNMASSIVTQEVVKVGSQVVGAILR